MALSREEQLELMGQAGAQVLQQQQPQPQQGQSFYDAYQAYLSQFAPPPEPRPSSIFDAFWSGIADVSSGDANVAKMNAIMADARGNTEEAAQYMRRAEELQARADRRAPENYVRPDGMTGFAHDIVRSIPYTAGEIARSFAAAKGGAIGGGMVAGPAGAAIGGGLGVLGSALYGGNREANRNQAETFLELIDNGMSPEDAYNQTFKRTYIPSLVATVGTDALLGGALSQGRRVIRPVL